MSEKNRNLRLWAKVAPVLVSLSVLCVTALAQEETKDRWLNKGHELCENGYYEEALGAYDEATEFDLENGTLWKGRILVERGSFEDALECFNRSIEINPESTEAQYLEGPICLIMHHPNIEYICRRG